MTAIKGAIFCHESSSFCMKFPDIFAAVHKTNLQLQFRLQFPASVSKIANVIEGCRQRCHFRSQILVFLHEISRYFAAVHKTNLQLQLRLQFPAPVSSFGSNEVMSYFYNSNILIIRGEAMQGKAKAKAEARSRARGKGKGKGSCKLPFCHLHWQGKRLMK